MPRTQPAATYTFAHAPGVSPVGEGPRAAALLHPNYPNPSNPTTTFSFELAYADRAELMIIDARGRLVRTLIQGELPAGHHQVVWDGRNEEGRPVASGVYYYRLRAAGLQYTRAATLIK